MTLPSPARRVLLPLGVAALAIGLAVPASGAVPPGLPVGSPVVSALRAPADSVATGPLGEGHDHSDADRRVGRVLPSASQESAVRALGARATWNRFGTPRVLTRDVGFLSGARAGAPGDVARAFLREHAGVFRLDAAVVDDLELLDAKPLLDGPARAVEARGGTPDTRGVGHVVLLRQRFGDLTSATEGLASVTLDPSGRVAMVSSSLTGDRVLAGSHRLTGPQAYARAAADVERTVAPDALTVVEQTTAQGFTTYRLPGVTDLQYVRRRALPTPSDGVRPVWEISVLDATDTDGEPLAVVSQVDAETGEVLVRYDGVDAAADNPVWKVFPANPVPLDPTAAPRTDNRATWCWQPVAGCTEVLSGGAAAGMRNRGNSREYDVDGNSGQPTFQTFGNNARTAPSYASFASPDAGGISPATSPSRDYTFAFTDQWFASRCNPQNFSSQQRNDVDAATTNLFVGHNRMHDWSYLLGFTEKNYNLQVNNVSTGEDAGGRDGDPEVGQTQAGAVGGGPTFQGRDNANQSTLQDGVPGITNQYLWQPLQAGFYAPCVDGGYDQSVIAHEYTHATSNRMTGGPDAGLTGSQATSMGESWSDLSAIEYLNGFSYVPVADENPFSVGSFVTGEKQRGIRNYGMNASPLNYSDIEYDANGVTSPHADGEIWSATNYDIRAAMIAKYDAQFAGSDKVLQRACAEGRTASTSCPGNRRWAQLMYDGFLIQPASPTMLDARDAMIAADKVRYGSANTDLLWDVFASRGMGESATSLGANGTDQTTSEDSNDRQPVAAYDSPLRTDEARVSFRPVAPRSDTVPSPFTVHVGTYEARVTPLATSTGAAATTPQPMVPGTYEFTARAPGHGIVRFTRTVRAGETVEVAVPLRPNVASRFQGATVTGDGGNLVELIDDTEATNMSVLGEGPVAGKTAYVQLAGGKQLVRDVNVSAALRPARSEDPADDGDPEEEPYDTGGQNRFSALRSFALLSCDSTAGKDCSKAESFTTFYTSPADAFPADRPRPTAPDLQLRAFDVPDTTATHVALRVLTNQCTGGPLYQREANPDDDPVNDPDCDTGSSTAPAAPSGSTSLSQAQNVRVSEFQVFSGTRAVSAVSLRALQPQVTAGNSPRLEGVVTDVQGAGVGGPAGLFARSFGESAYRQIGTVQVGEDGRFTTLVRPTSQTAYVVRVGGVSSRASVVRVFARMEYSSPRAGSTVSSPVTVTGALTPPYADQPIGLAEKLADGRYRYLSQTRTDSAGRFRVVSPRLSRGSHALVVYTSPTRGTDRGSRSVGVTVR